MTELRADTDVMRSKRNNLLSLEAQLRGIAADLVSLRHYSADHLYEGQFSRKIGMILAGSGGTAEEFRSRLDILATELGGLADNIDWVNSTSLALALQMSPELEGIFDDSPALETATRVQKLRLSEVDPFWFLAGLGTAAVALIRPSAITRAATHLSPFNPLNVPGVPKRTFAVPGTVLFESADSKKKIGVTLRPGTTFEIVETVQEDEKTWAKVTVDGEEGWTSSENLKEASIISASPIRGEDVPAYGGSGRYPRLAYDEKTPSNCTYYAAEAVKARSGGAIDLRDSSQWDSLGNGGTWARNARKSSTYLGKGISPITAVNQTPKEGTVYCRKAWNHVAYVEEVWLSDDNTKLFVVVSEENAISKTPLSPDSDHIEFTDAPEVRRYRRILVFENVAEEGEPPRIPSGGSEFMHFDYRDGASDGDREEATSQT